MNLGQIKFQFMLIKDIYRLNCRKYNIKLWNEYFLSLIPILLSEE